MAVTQPQWLHQDPELICQYCGRRETLPKDAAQLHRHLRVRLLQLTQAREATEAPLRSFQTMNDVWPKALVMVVAVCGYQTWGFVRGFSALGKVELSQALFAAFPLAMVVGMISGWLGMRHTYSVQLRPLLRARPPHAPGLSARCRNCGGDLPPVRAPQVLCSHCNASNLLDQTLTANAAALLQQEAQEYQRRLKPWTRDAALYHAPLRAFYRYAAAGAIGALIASGLLLALLLG